MPEQPTEIGSTSKNLLDPIFETSEHPITDAVLSIQRLHEEVPMLFEALGQIADGTSQNLQTQEIRTGLAKEFSSANRQQAEQLKNELIELCVWYAGEIGKRTLSKEEAEAKVERVRTWITDLMKNAMRKYDQ